MLIGICQLHGDREDAVIIEAYWTAVKTKCPEAVVSNLIADDGKVTSIHDYYNNKHFVIQIWQELLTVHMYIHERHRYFVGIQSRNRMPCGNVT